MKKAFALLLPALLLALSASAQRDSSARPQRKAPEPWTDRLVYGGNIGLQFGTYTLLDLSPMVGYKITDKLIGGVGGSYQYIRVRYSNNATYENSIYGYSLFGRYYIFDQLFAHAEYQRLNGEWQPWFRPDHRYWVTGVLVGGGYTQRIGENFGVALTVLFNVNESEDWPYQNPIIRAGFGFGF